MLLSEERKSLNYHGLQGGMFEILYKYRYHGIPVLVLVPSAGVQCANLDPLSAPSDSLNTGTVHSVSVKLEEKVRGYSHHRTNDKTGRATNKVIWWVKKVNRQG